MAEPERFAKLLESLADGTPVDWADAESATTSDNDRVWLQQLRRLGLAVAHQRRSPVRGGTWSHLVLIERIGAGAFGEVYRAHDPRLARDVALKLLYEPMVAHEARASAVIEEGRLLARVRHPSVVTVYGAECRDGQVGIWTEFIDGRTLQAFVAERGPLPAAEVTAIGLDLCRALAAVHEAGLLHRDIKAQNVMRETGGRIVLMDFGTGRDLDPVPGKKTDVSGTPLYLAPELLQGANASVESDLYSLGVLLYHLLTGSYPIAARTLPEVEEAHRLNRRLPILDARPDVPDDLAAAIDRSLSPDPGRRYASARDMAVVLGATDMRPSIDSPTSIRRSSRPSRRRALAGTVVLATTIAAGVALWLSVHSGTRADAPASVLVAAFANNTGNHQLDGAIEVALQRELINSRFVNVVAQERIDYALKLMTKPLDATLNTVTARELALRDGAIAAVIEGELNKVAEGYTVTARVVSVANGRISSTVREEAASAQELHAAVRRVSNGLRAALGEARDEIQASESRLEKVTTVSFFALKLYSDSWTLGLRDKWAAALDRVRLAVEADPQFASAQMWLAWCLFRNQGGGYTPAVAAVAKRAVALAPNALDWERHWIEGSAAIISADPAKRHQAVASYKALLDLVPAHYWGLNNLVTGLRGDFLAREAVPYALAAIRLEPSNRDLARRTFQLLLEVCDLEHADPLLDRLQQFARTDNVDLPPSVDPRIHVSRFPVRRAMCRSDTVTTTWELDALEASLLNLSAATRAHTVRFLKDWNLGLGRPRATARVIETVSAPLARAYLSASAAFFADDEPALRANLASMRLDAPAEDVAEARLFGFTRYEALFYLVRAGRVSEVEAILAKMAPSNPATRSAFDTIKACMSVARGDANRAIDLLANVRSAFTLPNFAAECYVDALIRRGRIDDAIAVLQDWESAQCPTPEIEAFRTRYLYRLAELYHQAGRDQSARPLLTYLATILAQADPNSPLLERVRTLQRTFGVSIP